MWLAIWLLLIAIDIAYEMFGVFRNRQFERRLWGNAAPPEPLTFYLRALMKAYWPAKLMLIVFWVWLGAHLFAGMGP